MFTLTKNHYLCRLTPYLIIGNIQKAKLRKQIITGNTYKLVNPSFENKFYIVHPSAKCPNKLQATFFYNDVPWSDIIRDNMEQIIDEMVSMGFYTITEEAIIV
jgi:hypothetical protein